MNSTSDIVAARRTRLRAWIEEHHAGVQQGFIAETGINQGELSALLGSKSFGEKKARALELAAKMPDGYLVTPLAIGHGPRAQSETPLSTSTRLANHLFGLATPRSRRALEHIIEAAKAGRLSEADLVLLESLAERFMTRARPGPVSAALHRKAKERASSGA